MNGQNLKPQRLATLLIVTTVGAGLSMMALGSFYLLVLLVHP
jgi:hypothetical protein